MSQIKYNFLIKCENEKCTHTPRPQWKRLRVKQAIFDGKLTCPYCRGKLTVYRYKRQ